MTDAIIIYNYMRVRNSGILPPKGGDGWRLVDTRMDVTHRADYRSTSLHTTTTLNTYRQTVLVHTTQIRCGGRGTHARRLAVRRPQSNDGIESRKTAATSTAVHPGTQTCKPKHMWTGADDLIGPITFVVLTRLSKGQSNKFAAIYLS